MDGNVTISIIGGDTDSLFLELQNLKVDRLLEKMISDGLLDSSNYPAGHKFFSNRYKAQVGCVKNECPAVTIKEIVTLRPKCYSILLDTDKAKKTAKGVQRHVITNTIKHEDYRTALSDTAALHVGTRRIGSLLHQLYTLSQSKLALGSFEDKSTWVAPNESVPYRHHSLGQVRTVYNAPQPTDPNIELPEVDDQFVQDGPSSSKRPRLEVSDGSSNEEDDGFPRNPYVL